ncbi:MAG: M15 family metallopeptidase, partial [Candidatus Saccharimonadales bacterium]
NPACNVAQCFANTTEGKWLAANAYLYGFVIRYPKGFENITGYEYEPWHVRYIGKSLSEEMHKTGVKTLEQFFGLPAAPNYN